MENESSAARDSGSEMAGVGRKAQARARSAARAKFAFYIHLAAYIGVNALLGLINLMTTPGAWWVLWPVMGWGFALLIHALVSFILPDLFGVRHRMYEQELARQLKK